ncbi:Imidazole glycerol phosphate synthase hisHF chloroplastic [Bienertia sinuspersici]
MVLMRLVSSTSQVLRFASENVFVPLTGGGGIRDFTDANGRHYINLEVASEYFRSGANKISIGIDVVYAAEEYLRTGVMPFLGHGVPDDLPRTVIETLTQRSMDEKFEQLESEEKMDTAEDDFEEDAPKEKTG